MLVLIVISDDNTQKSGFLTFLLKFVKKPIFIFLQQKLNQVLTADDYCSKWKLWGIINN